MKTHTFPNGITLTWDDTIQVGDLVTAYEKGYHIVTAIHHREYNPPLIYYKRVVSDSGKDVKSGGKPLVCCISYASKVTREMVNKVYKEEMNAAGAKRDNLLRYVVC